MAMPRPPARLSLCVFALALFASAPASAESTVPPDHAEKMTRGQEIFTKSVRALLTDKCLRCHGGEKTRSGLDLGSREGLLKGGDKGPVVVVGRSKDSRLYQYVAHLDKPIMPPKEDKLPDDVIAQLAAWIDSGAPYDKPLIEKTVAKKPMRVTDEDRKYWAFLPLQRPPEPAVKRRGVAADPHRLVRPGEAGREGADAERPGRPAQADPAGVFRPARPAAGAGRGRIVRRRPRPRRLRQADRPSARQPALRRTLGQALARPGPLRRQPRLRAGLRPDQPPTPTATSSSRRSIRICLTTHSSSGSWPVTSSSRTTRWR